MSTLHSHIDPHTHGVVNILPRSMLPLIHELAHSLPIALHCVHCLCTTQNFCLSAPGTLSAGEKKTHIHIDIWDLHIAHRTSQTVHILHFYVSHSLPYSLLLHFHIPINWNILHKMHFRSIIVALLSFHRIIKLEISEEEWQQKKWFVCLCKFLVCSARLASSESRSRSSSGREGRGEHSANEWRESALRMNIYQMMIHLTSRTRAFRFSFPLLSFYLYIRTRCYASVVLAILFFCSLSLVFVGNIYICEHNYGH